MKDKANEVTPQRSSEDSTLNTPLVEMDLDNFITHIKQETTWATNDHSSVTIFKSRSMRIVLVGLHENSELKKHTANGIISVQVLEGKINFTAEQKTVSLEKGQMIALQDKIPHSVVAVQESFFLLTLAMSDR